MFYMRMYQKFPDWPLGARTANGTALCHYVQLYHYYVSQSNEFCRHNPLCYFSTSVYFYYCLFRYLLSPETFGYTLVYHTLHMEFSHLRIRIFITQKHTGSRTGTIHIVIVPDAGTIKGFMRGLTSSIGHRYTAACRKQEVACPQFFKILARLFVLHSEACAS
jgi:hypothetical protein